MTMTTWSDEAEAIAEELLVVVDAALRGIEKLGDVSELPDDVRDTLRQAKGSLDYLAERCDREVREVNGS